MSQQPWGSRDAPDSRSNDGHSRTASGSVTAELPAPPASDVSTSSSAHMYGTNSLRRDLPREHSPKLPPLQRPPGVEDAPTARQETRSLGVHSILNAAQTDGSEPRGLRRTAAEMEGSGSEGRPPQLPPLGFSRPPSAESSYGESSGSPRSVSMRAPAPRRILTPRSPTIQRIASLGRLTGTIDAHQSPFLSPGSRNYTVEPGSGGIPPLPTPPGAARSGYGFPPVSRVLTPPGQARRTSMSNSLPPSGATSPPAPHPSYPRHPGSASPGYAHPPGGGHGQLQPYPHGPTSGNTGPINQQPIKLETSPGSYSIPISSSGQAANQYSIMTLSTGKGSIQIPVDTSAASKQADEKRKRNAGASARFRERRKMKEKEASTTIARLEQQLREASDDVDFYRRERDILADLVYQAPGGNRHFPRPASPRRGRVPGTPGEERGDRLETASGTGSGSYSGFSDVQEVASRMPQDPSSAGRNQRRRTDSGAYNLPPPPSATSIPPPTTSYTPGFAPIVPAPIGGPSSPHSAGAPPPSRFAAGLGAPPPGMASHAASPPQGMTPRQALEQSRSGEPHDRSWTSGGPGGPAGAR